MKYELYPRYDDFSLKGSNRLFMCANAAKKINPNIDMESDTTLITREKSPKKKGWRKVSFSINNGEQTVKIGKNSFSSFYEMLERKGLYNLCESNATLWVKLENV